MHIFKINVYFFLNFRSCPAHLEAGLTRVVLDETRANYLNPNRTSMSPTGSAAKDSETFASLADLHPAHPALASATSTKGSQGKGETGIFIFEYS